MEGNTCPRFFLNFRKMDWSNKEEIENKEGFQYKLNEN